MTSSGRPLTWASRTCPTTRRPSSFGQSRLHVFSLVQHQFVRNQRARWYWCARRSRNLQMSVQDRIKEKTGVIRTTCFVEYEFRGEDAPDCVLDVIDSFRSRPTHRNTASWRAVEATDGVMASEAATSTFTPISREISSPRWASGSSPRVRTGKSTRMFRSDCGCSARGPASGYSPSDSPNPARNARSLLASSRLALRPGPESDQLSDVSGRHVPT